jgi:transcriptional regulator of acetoin/glycerol metabolism
VQLFSHRKALVRPAALTRVSGREIMQRICPWFSPEASKDKAAGRLLRTLHPAGGRKSSAAGIMVVSRVTLWRWLKEHDIRVEAVVRR